MLFSCGKRQTRLGAVVKAIPVPNFHLKRLFQISIRVVLGSIALGIVGFVAYRLHFSVAAASAVFLLVVMVQSLAGDFAAAAILSLTAFLCLDYFFTEPLFSFLVADPTDFLDLTAFLVVALVITRLVSRLRLE